MADDFNEVSRSMWQQVRSGTPFEGPTPDTGPYTIDFYQPTSRGYGVRFTELIAFFREVQKDSSRIYDRQQFMAREVNFIGQPSMMGPPREFFYENVVLYDAVRKENVTVSLGARLNKRIDFLEDPLGFTIFIDASKEVMYGSLLAFYDKTKQYRKPVPSTSDNPEDFQINDAYLAIELRAANMVDFTHLIQHVAGEKIAAQLKDRITTRFVEKLQLETNVSSLQFLYRNIPEFAYEGLRKKISSRTAFGHLISLKKYDESSWFIDSSNAVLNILRVIGSGKLLYEAFHDNPVLVKQLYENLDGTSVFEGTVTKNRMVFASLLWMLCANQRFGLDNTPTHTFFIGPEYELDSNVLSSSDAKKDAIFLRQFKRSASERTKYIPTGIGQPMAIKERPFEPVDDGAYFHPLTPVFLTDTSGKEPITYKVPAIYVKTLSDEAEWKDIMTNVRIGVNVLSIVLSIASLGAATPALVTALALTDIAVSTFDIGVALAEDELMQSDEGRAFLEGYNKVTLAVAGVTALPLAGSLITAGTRLLGKATVESTKNFLRASIARLMLEIEISGFVKNTLRFVEPTELFHSAEFLTRADKLWKAGVIFVEGVSDTRNGQKLVAALYDGQVIAQGTRMEVMEQLKGASENLLNGTVDNFREADFLAKWEKQVIKTRGGTGYLGGQKLSRSRIKFWIKEISRISDNKAILAIAEEGSELFKSLAGNRAGFNPFRQQLVLRKGMTEYEIFHEFKHLEEYTLIGHAEYVKGMGILGGSPQQVLIRTYKREIYVYNEVMRNASKFNKAELKHARSIIDNLIDAGTDAGIDLTKF